MSDEVTLQCKSVRKEYLSEGARLTVLQNFDLTLRAGERCALLGPSGSGKTTVLSLAAGLDSPSSGSVQMGGRDLQSLSEDDRASHRNRVAGFVFQNYQLVPSLTALENVLLPAEILGDEPHHQFRARGLELLERVGLTSRASHYPGQLSGGEQQRIALARAFINHPKILFADEPTGSLDAENAQMAWQLMEELNTAAKTTLLLVTHDEDLARRVGRTIRLRGGVVVA
jgi:putative ABC transport system ATP-binding protein